MSTFTVPATEAKKYSQMKSLQLVMLQWPIVRFYLIFFHMKKDQKGSFQETVLSLIKWQSFAVLKLQPISACLNEKRSAKFLNFKIHFNPHAFFVDEHKSILH